MRKDPPPFPGFHEFMAELPHGIGANTRAITLAILWAGERIARAVADTREAHQVREMSEELGKAFLESVRPPPGSVRPPPKKR